MSEITIAPTAKRRRGGQRGNLNGSKNSWLTFWRRRAVKEADRWIIPLIEKYSTELIDGKGGDHATAAERRAIEIAQTARGCAMLILKECSERGMVVSTDAGWDLAPGAKELSRFMTVELSALKTIGMSDRRPKDVLSLDQIDWTKPSDDAPDAPESQAATNGGAN
jgi:hypothetical protein